MNTRSYSALFLSVCFSLYFSPIAFAQLILPPLSVDFTVDGQLLRNPNVGGLNAPQICKVDLNNNGTDDLFIFDRTGDVVLTFINEGTANEVDYQYNPYYIRNFPRIANWALLRDFNNDGAMDIYAYSDVPGIDGVLVYEGYYQSDELHFKRFNFYDSPKHLIYFDLPTGGMTQLYVSTEDYPEVTDVNYDGDLDFVTFGNGGGYIHYYENQSVELGYGTDSLIYGLVTTCFGGAYESGLTGCLDLSGSIDTCYTGLLGSGDDRHAGSTLLMFDNDNDNDKELWLGDVNTPTVVMLTNGGNNQSTWWTDQDCNFPTSNVSAQVYNFPANFHLDVDNDGKNDFIVAPNADKNSEDDQNVWFYKNTTDNENPVFAFQKSTLFVEDMIDMGSGSKPIFVDYNADGLLDIIAGNESFYVIGGAKDSRLFLYENIGSATTPAYELVDDDYLNMSQFSGSNWSFAPCAGDLDNDGDIDLLIGEEFGALFYLENTAGPNQPFQFANPQFNYMGIDVGLVSTPYIIDLNRDGLQDLVIGERNGFLNYFQNIGTSTEPMFEADEEIAPNNPFLGEVDTRSPFSVEGYVSPFFIDFDGSYMLFCGTNNRGIMRYTNIDDNLTGTFTLEEDFYGDIHMGLRTHLAIADLNSNGVLDMIIGNRRGGLSPYVSSFTSEGTVPVITPEFSINIDISPNPTTDLLNISIQTIGQAGQLELKIYNSIGQKLIDKICYSTREDIDVSGLSSGIYFVEIGNSEGRAVKKFIKN